MHRYIFIYLWRLKYQGNTRHWLLHWRFIHVTCRAATIAELPAARTPLLLHSHGSSLGTRLHWKGHFYCARGDVRRDERVGKKEALGPALPLPRRVYRRRFREAGQKVTAATRFWPRSGWGSKAAGAFWPWLESINGGFGRRVVYRAKKVKPSE
jgi:hypothetical protein